MTLKEVTPGDNQEAAVRWGEVRRQFGASADGGHCVYRTTAVRVTTEEREALERGEMPDSVLLRALQQQVIDDIIEGMEDGCDAARPGTAQNRPLGPPGTVGGSPAA